MATRDRGHAILELALVAPLLVLLVLYSIYFTELVQAKLKLLEAARFAAWELTSFSLSDYGSKRHQEVFEQAAGAVIRETQARYRHLDSADNRSHSGLASSLGKVQVALTQRLAAPKGRIDDLSAAGSPERNQWTSAIFGAARGGLGAVLAKQGFNAQGEVRARVSTALVNRLLPRHFLDRRAGGGLFRFDPFGDRDLSRLPLESGLTLIADGWTLADGADSVMRDGRAGLHRFGREPSGLYRQVQRMTFLGMREMLGTKVPVPDILSSLLPDPLGTYVVSHNYRPELPGKNKNACSYLEKYPPEAKAGLNNLQQSSRLDHELPKCFDTAPFRDQSSYDDSLYIQMFKRRGDWFMGCKHPQSDDPVPASESAGAEGRRRVNCE